MPKRKTTSEMLEKLVELVRQNPVLYDPKLPGHKDAVRLSNIWKSIATAMEDPEMTGPLWKSKWRNLRDTYVRKRKELSTRSGDTAKRVAKWPFMETMGFLIPYIEESSTETYVPDPDNSIDGTEASQDSQEFDIDDDSGSDKSDRDDIEEIEASPSVISSAITSAVNGNRGRCAGKWVQTTPRCVLPQSVPQPSQARGKESQQRRTSICG